MQDDVLEIPVIPDLDAFKSGMSELPAIGDKAVKDMASKMGSGFATAEKSGKAAAKGVSTGFSAEFNKISGAAGALAGAVGGSFGKIGSIANSALRPIAEVGTALGPVGLAGALGVGLVTAAAAGAAALIQLGAAAGEAGERLDKLGLLTADQSLAAERLRDANEASAAATDLLTLAMGTASPAVENLTLAWVGLKVAVGEAVEEVGGFRSGMDALDVQGFATRMSTLPGIFGTTASAVAGLTAGYAGLVEKGEEFTATVQEQGEVMARVYGPTPEMLAEVGQAHRDMATAATEAARESAAERAKIDRDFAASHAMWVDYDLRLADEERRLEKQYNDERTESREAYHDSYLKMLQQEGAAADQALRGEQQRTDALAGFWLGLTNTGAEAFQSFADRVVASYEERVAGGEELSAAEKKEANTAFNVSQGFAIAQAFVQAALIGIGVTAQMAPYSGPLAPVFGASAASASLAVALSAISSTPPPEFPMGMTPDHRSVGVRDDEGIANGRAMRALGGPDALDDLNRGGLPGASEVQVFLQLDREVIGTAVAKVTGGSASGVIRAARGRRPVYGGGY